MKSKRPVPLCTLLLAILVMAVAMTTARAEIAVTDLTGHRIRLTQPAQRILITDGRFLMALALIDGDPVSRLVAWPHDIDHIGPETYDRGCFSNRTPDCPKTAAHPPETAPSANTSISPAATISGATSFRRQPANSVWNISSRAARKSISPPAVLTWKSATASFSDPAMAPSAPAPPWPHIIERPGFSSFPAIRDGRVWGLSHQLLNSPLDILALEVLSKGIYPKLFEALDPDNTKTILAERFLAISLDGIYWTTLSSNR